MANLLAGRYKEVKDYKILQFVAIYYYMGLVKLPAKKDYWRQGGDWPAHGITVSMSRDCFQYIWWYFHVSYNGDDMTSNNAGEEDNVDEIFDDFWGMEMDGYKRDDQDNSNEDGMEEDIDVGGTDIPDRASEIFANGTDDNENDVANDDEVQSWYHKVEDFLDHVNKTSQKLVNKSSDFLSLNEMMKLFKGWSTQTHMMKNKPIKKGFKFWANSCSETGFVYRFVPSGKMEGEKIYDVVNNMVDALSGMDEHKEDEDTNYVFAMDNYFTLRKEIGENGLQGKGVGVVGTTRFCAGWPPKEFQVVKDDCFNTVYYCDNKEGFRIF